MSLLIKSAIAGQRRAESVVSSPLPVPAGPEAAPPTPVSPPSASSAGMSSTQIAVLVALLSILGLVASGIALWKVLAMKKWRNTSLSQQGTEIEKHDTESQASLRHCATIASPPGVGWTPQIRSISCSMPVEDSDKMHVTRAIRKRAHSPPPTSFSKISNPFTDPTPKSAPPRTVTFLEKDMLSPHTVTPHALSVSSLQTRTLERYAQPKLP
ncbi:hypothetical protein V8B97DRAFT_1406310 [Scleroderma yunnanense]